MIDNIYQKREGIFFADIIKEEARSKSRNCRPQQKKRVIYYCLYRLASSTCLRN